MTESDSSINFKWPFVSYLLFQNDLRYLILIISNLTDDGHDSDNIGIRDM